MVRKIRGRERTEICDACGRTIPRDKTITYTTTQVFSTDLKTGDDVKAATFVEKHYCISCAKAKRIFEKLKRRAIEQSQKKGRWNSGQRW
jgi:ribosomal protein S26